MDAQQFGGEWMPWSAELINEEIRSELGRSTESAEMIGRRVFEKLLRRFAASQNQA